MWLVNLTVATETSEMLPYHFAKSVIAHNLKFGCISFTGIWISNLCWWLWKETGYQDGSLHSCHQGPLLLTWFNSVPSMFSNHMLSKCGIYLPIYSLNSTDAPLKVGNRWSISSYSLWWMWLIVHVNEKDPAWYIPFPRADGGFHWTDRSSFQYEKWNLGEPNSNGNDDEDCVLMYTKGHDGFYWDDVGCDEYHPFMCKTDQGMIYLTLYNMKANVSKAPLITRWKKQLLISWFCKKDTYRTSVYEYIQ